MGQAKEGVLIYDQQQDRYDICYDAKDYYGGLHCGTCFDVFFQGKWITTRIEYSWEKSEWYLVGLSHYKNELHGLKVRLYVNVKTVAELAKELNISTQAIYKKINKSLKAELSPYIKTINGQRVIDEQGIDIIKTSLQLVVNQQEQLQTVANQQDQQLQLVANQQDQLQTDNIDNIENGTKPANNAVANQVVDQVVNQQEQLQTVANQQDQQLQLVANQVVNQQEQLQTVANQQDQQLQLVANQVASQQEQLQTVAYKNTEAILEMNVRAAKLEEANKLLEEKNKSLEESNEFFMRQSRALQDELNKEREHSRTQSDKLANLAEQLAELSRNNQILLGAEQSRTNPALLMGGNEAEQGEEQPIRKKSFWSFFKKS